MATLANVCNLALVALGLGLVVWFAVFMTSTRKRNQVLATTAAQYAAEVGGTRTLRMGA
jgi:hypothetical protein